MFPVIDLKFFEENNNYYYWSNFQIKSARASIREQKQLSPKNMTDNAIYLTADCTVRIRSTPVSVHSIKTANNARWTKVQAIKMHGPPILE